MVVISLLAMLGLYQAPAAKAVTTRGRAQYERVCGSCHDLGMGTANPRTRAQWQAVVDDMAAMGAPGSKADFKLIVDYLSTNYGAK